MRSGRRARGPWLFALVLGEAAAACAPTVRCPGELIVTLAPAAGDGVLGGMPLSTTDFFVTPESEGGWSTAASNSSVAPPSLGFVAFTLFHGPGGQPAQLELGLPFPLRTGQTLDLSEGEPADLTMAVQMTARAPGAAAALAALDACMLLKGSAVTNCAQPAGQTVAGTLAVVATQPFQARVDATFTPANDATPSATLAGDLTLVDMPRPCVGF
jgi:hypothetical protein